MLLPANAPHADPLQEFFQDGFVLQHVKFGGFLLLFCLGWILALGMCAANVPPGCNGSLGVWNAASAMDAMQVIFIAGVSVGWFVDLRSKGHLLLDAPFAATMLLGVLVFAGFMTVPGLSPTTRSQCCSPGATVAVVFLCLTAGAIIVYQLSRAWRELTRLDFGAYVVSRLAIVVFYCVCISVAGTSDPFSALTFSPFVYSYVVATFCQFEDRASLLCLALALAVMAQSVSMGEILFIDVTNCRNVPSLKISGPWFQTNISSPHGVRANICLTNAQGTIATGPKPQALQVCEIQGTQQACDLWPGGGA
jgi:hypothetical protein